MNDLLRCLIREMAQAQTRKLGVPRKFRIEQLLDMISDPPKYAIRFSKIERPGFNPNMRWEEGIGTFMFPLNSFIKEFLVKGNLEFSKLEYAHIFKIPQGLINLDEDTIAEDIPENFAKLYYDNNKHNIEHFMNSYKELYEKHGGKNLSFYKTLKSSEFDILLTKPKTSIVLKKLGINGFIDNGNGHIFSKGHISELSQLVVTNSAVIQSNYIETIKTADLFRSREVLFGKRSASKEYTSKAVSDYYNSLGDDQSEKMHVNILVNAGINITYEAALRVLNHIEGSASQIDSDTGMDAFWEEEDYDINGIVVQFLKILFLKLKMSINPKLVKNKFSNDQFKHILNDLKNFAQKNFDDDTVFHEEIAGECNRILYAIDHIYNQKKD